jgi:hypothetical protein
MNKRFPIESLAYGCSAILCLTACILHGCQRSAWLEVKVHLLLIGRPYWQVSFDKDRDWIPAEVRTTLGLPGVVVWNKRVIATVGRFRDIAPYPASGSGSFALQCRLDKAQDFYIMAQRRRALVMMFGVLAFLAGLAMTLGRHLSERSKN